MLCADTHKFYIKLKNMLPPEKEQEPAFSVRDYTPSPRSVITNNNVSLFSVRDYTPSTRSKDRPGSRQNPGPGQNRPICRDPGPGQNREIYRDFDRDSNI